MRAPAAADLALREPKKVSKHWAATGTAEPTDTEILFYALVLVTASASVTELDKWAQRAKIFLSY